MNRTKGANENARVKFNSIIIWNIWMFMVRTIDRGDDGDTCHTFDHFYTGGNLSGFYAFLDERNTQLLICCLPFFFERATKRVKSSPPAHRSREITSRKSEIWVVRINEDISYEKPREWWRRRRRNENMQIMLLDKFVFEYTNHKPSNK